MKYILNYEEFLEAKLFSNSNIIGDENSDLFKELMNIKNKKFENDSELLKKFTSKKYYNKKKINLNLFWNHKVNHSIIERIEKRSDFTSINEFNLYIKNKLNYLLPDKITMMEIPGRYTLYDKEKNLSIIISNDLKYTELTIISIINGLNDNKVIKVINI